MQKIILNNRVSVEDTKFLIAVNKEARELYVLSREFPKCLIYVEPTTPLNFIVVDLFEDNEGEDISILTSENFKKELREYVISQSIDFN